MTQAAKRINWNASDFEETLIDQIVQRAFRETEVYEDRLECTMDITATHLNGCPLDLERLRAAPEFDFYHDIAGIHRHIDRTTGALMDCFFPRCASTKEAA